MKPGFDTSGESLTMSPASMKKYLAAARLGADHLVLKPDGFSFAPHPVVTDTDRDKYCVARIIAFYQRQRTDYADYFRAAWRFQHREALGKPDAAASDDFPGPGARPASAPATLGPLLRGRILGGAPGRNPVPSEKNPGAAGGDLPADDPGAGRGPARGCEQHP